MDRTSRATPHVRDDYLDNVKWTLAILVILHHAAAIAGLDPFPVNLPHVAQAQQYQYHILGTLQSINQNFFMSLFFFISAYFVIPSHGRKGSRAFMKGRLVRLGIPTLATILLLDPLALYITDTRPLAASLAHTFAGYAQSMKSLNLVMGVTWFCWSLIVFSAAFVLVRRLAPGVLAGPRTPRPLPSFPAMLAFALFMIPLNFLGLFLMDRLGQDFLGFHLLKYFPMYIAMFALGLMAWQREWLGQLTFRHAFVWIVVWMLARVFVNPVSYLASRPFEVLGMSIFLLYGYRVLFNTKNRWTRLMSRSAYAAYVLQVVPLCLVGTLYAPHATPYPLLNFAVVAPPSILLAFGLGMLACKAPGLRRIF